MQLKVGIPCMAESSWLPSTLDALSVQSRREFEVWICVNHPRHFIDTADHRAVVDDNRRTLAWLRHNRLRYPFAIRLIDATGRESAPRPKVAGVGWARKRIFDSMVERDPHAFVMVSLDADTRVTPDYLEQVAKAFQNHTNAVALAAPYWHPLPDESSQALRLLRYEIFLRYYQLSLWRIGSPYAYLPLGSAMAFTREAYVRVGGVPLRAAAEDFYLLQKLRKMGPVMRWIDSRVYPAARPSFRVPFGTGKMMEPGGFNLSRQRFPFYPQELFGILKQTFDQFPNLFHGDVKLPCHEFLVARLNGYAPFERMRQNARDETAFVRACHERIDALRSLQFLRFSHAHAAHDTHAETQLNHLLSAFGRSPVLLRFDTKHLAQLNQLRHDLFVLEGACQKRFMDAWDHRATW